MPIHKHYLNSPHLRVSALSFIPKSNVQNVSAVITHGYTSHKGAILAWAEKLMQMGVPTTLFDLPGHYLGESSEVSSLEILSEEMPQIFKEGVNFLKSFFAQNISVVGGHSLGALLALEYLAQSSEVHQGFAVGLAATSKSGKHLYQDPLFEKMLEFRSGLVSPVFHHQKMFPWIRLHKENLQMSHKKIFLLSGKDDLVAKAQDVDLLGQELRRQGNQVECSIIEKLPHHEPEKAAIALKDWFVRTYSESPL